MEDLKKCKVFISSPSDLQDERKLIAEHVKNMKRQGIIFEPLRFEVNLPVTSSVRPQSLINEELLDKADILIGIFGTRFGTKTEKADSGTVEEIETFIAKKRPVILYFYNIALNTTQLTSKDLEELKKINEFKEKYKDNLVLSFKFTSLYPKISQFHISFPALPPKIPPQFDTYRLRSCGLHDTIKSNTKEEPLMGTPIAIKGKNEYQTIKTEAIYTSIQQEFRDFVKHLEDEQAVWLEDVFNTVIGKRLAHVGYMDVSRFLDYPMTRQVCALEWKRKLSCIYQLFMVRKAETDNSQTAVFYEFWKKYSALRKPLSGKEQEAVLYWFFTKHSGRLRNRKALLIAMIEQFCPEDAKRKWELSGNILSNHIYCEILPVSSLEEYVDVAAGFQEECRGRKLYYRGHADVNYDLLPSIKRYKNWMENEDRMYHELLVRCPNDFRDCKCHLDYLVEMQHYGLPTRLLDITESPMVALYFACCDRAKKTGEVIMFPVEQHEVKYFHSDTVAVLAALSTRTWEYREELRKSVDAGDKRAEERLLRQLAREIKSKNPAFEPEIHIEDVTRNLFVSPVKSNQRIVKQEGAFIICGLDTEGPGRNSLQELRIREHESNPDFDEKGRIVVCVVENKEAILEQLDRFGINQAALFPEIDQVTGYIKGQYL